MLETSALESLYGGLVPLSTRLIKQNICFYYPPTQHHTFHPSCSVPERLLAGHSLTQEGYVEVQGDNGTGKKMCDLLKTGLPRSGENLRKIGNFTSRQGSQRKVNRKFFRLDTANVDLQNSFLVGKGNPI